MAQPRFTRVWFLTGCSSGLGKLFVSAIVARGDKVIATARDISTLSEFEHNKNVHLLRLDVTDTQDILNKTAAKAIQAFGHIDVLVNNAGYVLSHVWEETRQSDLLHQFNTNVFGPLNLTRAFLPHMRSRRSGTVIFMSSIAAWLGVAVGGPYSASKFALEGSVESLEKEVAPFGVHVHLAVLGQFRTAILESTRRKTDRTLESISDYDGAVEAFQTRLEETNGKQPGDPVQAVERVVDAVCRTGHFAGYENIPLRIVLGSDAIEIIRDQCQGMLRDLEGQRELARSTDFPGGGEVERYK